MVVNYKENGVIEIDGNVCWIIDEWLSEQWAKDKDDTLFSIAVSRDVNSPFAMLLVDGEPMTTRFLEKPTREKVESMYAGVSSDNTPARLAAIEHRINAVKAEMEAREGNKSRSPLFFDKADGWLNAELRQLEDIRDMSHRVWADDITDIKLAKVDMENEEDGIYTATFTANVLGIPDTITYNVNEDMNVYSINSEKTGLSGRLCKSAMDNLSVDLEKVMEG